MDIRSFFKMKKDESTEAHVMLEGVELSLDHLGKLAC